MDGESSGCSLSVETQVCVYRGKMATWRKAPLKWSGEVITGWPRVCSWICQGKDLCHAARRTVEPMLSHDPQRPEAELRAGMGLRTAGRD